MHRLKGLTGCGKPPDAQDAPIWTKTLEEHIICENCGIWPIPKTERVRMRIVLAPAPLP
jgi:hypothetical protein